MVLDPATILVIHLLIILLVSVSYFVTWLDARREDALLWMSGGTLAAGFGVIARFTLPPPFSFIISNGLVEAAGFSLWFACRRLQGKPVWPSLLPMPMLIWCVLPAFAFFGSLGLRITIANAALGLLFALAAREVRISARENQALRVYMVGLLGLQAAVYAVWAGYNFLLPPARQSHLLTLRGLMPVDLVSLAITLMMAIGLIGLVREKTVRLYRQAALLDAVTSIENRRAFDETLPHLVAEHRRRGEALAVIMMDADHFKFYNDRYGHPQGDACLRQIAQALKDRLVAAGGRVYRYGGEEFAALVSVPDRAAIESLAEGLRQSVRDLRLSHESHSAGIVTISLGVALAEPSSHANAAALLSAADQALYQAKHGGRDRVIILAGPAGVQGLPEPKTAPI